MKRRDFLKAIPVGVGMVAVGPGVMGSMPAVVPEEPFYVGLFTASGVEVNGAGYARQRMMGLSDTVTFPAAGECWGEAVEAWIFAGNEKVAGLKFGYSNRIFVNTGDTVTVSVKLDAT